MNMNKFEEGREIGWNDSIEKDNDFHIVAEGDYDFEVIGFERGRHNGSDKLPPCNKAIISLRLSSPEDETILTHNLFLHTKTEGMLCAFFTAIGQRKKGERIVMDWNRVIGARGRCKVGVRSWTGQDGLARVSNEIKRFYEPTEGTASRTYEPGRF